MRNQAYDTMCKEALDRITNLPTEKMTNEVIGIRDALKVVLLEEDDANLQAYYKRIEEFYTVNPTKGLEYMNGQYLLTAVVRLKESQIGEIVGVDEIPEGAEVLEGVEIVEG